MASVTDRQQQAAVFERPFCVFSGSSSRLSETGGRKGSVLELCGRMRSVPSTEPILYEVSL